MARTPKDGLAALPLHARKCIAAKLIVHEALRRSEGVAGTEGYGPLRDAVQAAVESAADDALSDPAETERFKTFLDRLPDAARVQTASARRPLVAELAGLVSEGVKLYRACPDPLVRAFDGALAVTHRLYEDAGVPATVDVVLAPEFVIDESPHGLPLAGHMVAGEVTGGSGRRVLHLVLSTRDFTWGAARAIPYVLFHELVVHAFSTRAPEGPGTSSPFFAEGWMDVVAHDVHEAAVDDQAPLTGFAAAFDHPDDTLRAAAAMHGARYEPGGADGYAYAQRRVGRDAADRLRRLVRAGAGDARAPFWSLSLALNRSGLDAATLDDVARAVEEATFDPARAEGLIGPLRLCLDALGAAGTAAERIAAAESFAGQVASGALR